MRILLVATDAPVAAGEGATWSVERVVGFRRERLRSEVARVKKRVQDVVGVACGAGGAISVLGCILGGVVAWAIGAAHVHDGMIPVVILFGLIGGAGIGIFGFFGVGFGGKSELAASQIFDAALEGHIYVPLPRTRVWGTRGARP
jgi:hypothetical protein